MVKIKDFTLASITGGHFTLVPLAVITRRRSTNYLMITFVKISYIKQDIEFLLKRAISQI